MDSLIPILNGMIYWFAFVGFCWYVKKTKEYMDAWRRR